MKIITYKELGEYIGKQASEYFGRCYSYNVRDYEEEFYRGNGEIIYNDDGTIIVKWEYHIEIANVGYVPLIIDWLEVYSYDSQKDFDYHNYNNVDYLIY